MLVQVVSSCLTEESSAAVVNCSKQTAGESGGCGSSLLFFWCVSIYIHIQEYIRKGAVFISFQGKFGNFLCPLPEVAVDPPSDPITGQVVTGK